MSYTLGPVREVWFAKSSTPTQRSSFLVRDDAFSITHRFFGRTQRLDQPVNLGPGSVWRQTTWEGGSGQYVWRDRQMFREGNADVWSRPGRVRMWPGWKVFEKFANIQCDGFAISPGGTAQWFGTSLLYYGSRNMWATWAAPSGGHRLRMYHPELNEVQLAPATPPTGARGYRALCPATEDGATAPYLYAGVSNGLWIWHAHASPNWYSGTWYQDTAAPTSGVEWDSLLAWRDGLYYCSGKGFWKRTPTAAYGIIGKHTRIANHNSAIRTIGVAAWNNRVWYGIQFEGARVVLATTDGVVSQTVVEIPEPFVLTRIVAHQGSLYLFGGRPQDIPGGGVQPNSQAVVWRYTGSSLRKLWEGDNEDRDGLYDGRSHLVNGAAAWGDLLVWSRIGYRDSPVAPRPGLMMYDPSRDAVFEGPTFPTDPTTAVGLSITNLVVWHNTLVVSFRDHRNYQAQAAGVNYPIGLAAWRWPRHVRTHHTRKERLFKGRSIEAAPAVLTQFVESSRYSGPEEVVNELKVWLRARMRVRIPAHTRVVVKLILDEATTVTVGTFPHNGNGRWRTVEFALKGPGGVALRSTTVQYRLELQNLDTRQNSVQNPEVSTFEVEWMPVAKPYRVWSMRAVLQDGQARLGGTPNVLTTAAAQALVLQSLLLADEPLLMWGPFSAPVDPSTLTAANATEVLSVPDSFALYQYRLTDDDDEVSMESSFQVMGRL